jgi:tetratricopeptide (TPR) repeat protein
MRPWLQGDFDGASRLYGEYAEWLPEMGRRFLVDMELERAHYRSCAELLKEAGNKDEPGVMMRRARLLYLTRDIREAEATAHKCGLKQALRVALHLSNTLALVRLERGEYQEAIEQFGGMVKLPKKAETKIDEPEIILALNGMALGYLGAHQLDAATHYAGLALEFSKNSWEDTSIPALDSLATLSRVQIEQHDFQKAHESLNKCAQGRQKLYGAGNPKIAEVLELEAKFDMLTGDAHQALPLASQAVAMRQVIASSQNPWPERRLQTRAQTCAAQGYWPARALLTLGNAYAATGDQGKAAQCFDNAIPILEGELGADALVVQQARARRGTLRPTPAAVNP